MFRRFVILAALAAPLLSGIGVFAMASQGSPQVDLDLICDFHF